METPGFFDDSAKPTRLLLRAHGLMNGRRQLVVRNGIKIA
jgi:hypothetical protein